jgi:hypothetical protein
VEWRCVGSAEFEHISKNVREEDTGKDTCMLVHSRQGTCGGHRYSIWGNVVWRKRGGTPTKYRMHADKATNGAYNELRYEQFLFHVYLCF